MNSWEMSTLGVISTSSTRISQADQTLFLLKTSCKFIWSYLSCRCLCFWSILKTSWKNPANILRTSREHLENIKRTSIDYLEKIQKHLWSSKNICEHLSTSEHILITYENLYRISVINWGWFSSVWRGFHQSDQKAVRSGGWLSQTSPIPRSPDCDKKRTQKRSFLEVTLHRSEGATQNDAWDAQWCLIYRQQFPQCTQWYLRWILQKRWSC